MRQFIFPIALLIAVALTLLAEGCTLHENPIGHRIDPAPTVIRGSAAGHAADEDGGAR